MESEFPATGNASRGLCFGLWYAYQMVSPRTASLVSLGALPAVAYYTLVSDPIVSVALLNVGIIATALYLIFSPINDGGHDHSNHT